MAVIQTPEEVDGRSLRVIRPLPFVGAVNANSTQRGLDERSAPLDNEFTES
jgi:hypothetical protein